MSTYYYKNLKILAPFVIASNEPHFDIQTVSLKTNRVSQGHQRWELSFSVQPEGYETNELFVDMLTSGQGSSDTMIMPQFPFVTTYSASGTVTVSSAGSVGDSTVSVSGSFAVGHLKKGSFIKFSESDKVYILTSDFNLASGTTLNIFPSLKSALTTSATLQYGDDCVLTYYRDIGASTNITYEDGVLANPGQITLYEAV